MVEIKEGKKAPAFSLIDADGKKVSSKDYSGRWLAMYFYPKDDTPGCTSEACEFTDIMGEFEKLDCDVVGVSPDSPESHAKFTKKKSLKVKLLSDTEHKVLQKYNAWGIKKMYGREFEGVIRSTVLIDPKGKIAHYWPRVSPKGHAEAVRNTLQELKNN